MAIALVVDVSGSMEQLIQPVRDSLRKALPSLKKEDRVALFSFSGEPRMIVGLTRNVEELTSKIKRFRARGETNINDAVVAASEYLHRTAPDARSIIILVSDMFPSTAGKNPSQIVKDKLVASDVTLFGIRVPGPHDPKYAYADEAEARALFAAFASRAIPGAVFTDKLAEDSGGFVMNVYRFEGIPAAVETLLQIVKTRYTLGFYPSPSGQAGSVRKLGLLLKNNESIDRMMPGAFLRFRTQYRVPGPASAKPQAESPPLNSAQSVQKQTIVPQRASGTFEVNLVPLPPDDKVTDPTLSRMSFDKQFHGGLEGTSKGQMVAVGTDVRGSAGYVAIERVTGTLQGRTGTFALQHSGTMTRGAPSLTITVVPDSGTGELVGLTGRMTINIVDGKHFYEFEYALLKPL
jgi:VWFA-related protein